MKIVEEVLQKEIQRKRAQISTCAKSMAMQNRSLEESREIISQCQSAISQCERALKELGFGLEDDLGVGLNTETMPSTDSGPFT